MQAYSVAYLNNVVGTPGVRYINVPIEELAAATKQHIDEGSAVWFGCDVGKHFNRKMAVMDTNMLEQVPLLRVYLGIPSVAFHFLQRFRWYIFVWYSGVLFIIPSTVLLITLVCLPPIILNRMQCRLYEC